MALQPRLSQTWSETPKTGFLVTWSSLCKHSHLSSFLKRRVRLLAAEDLVLLRAKKSFLPKLHKRSRFIANSSSCTTTSLSKVATSCLTAIKNHWIKYFEKTYEREGINYFWFIKNSTEILNKLKTKDFQASTISTYDFFYALYYVTT